MLFGCSEVQPAVGGQRSELGASRRTSGWGAACLSEYSVPTGAGTRTRTWRWSLGLFSGSESPAEADLPPGSAPVRFLVLRAENNYFNFKKLLSFKVLKFVWIWIRTSSPSVWTLAAGMEVLCVGRFPIMLRGRSSEALLQVQEC